MNRPVSVPYVIGILGALLIMGVLVWCASNRNVPTPVGAERAKARELGRTEMVAHDAAMLSNYAWQDQTRGIVRLPAARAIEVSLQEWQDPLSARSNLIQRLDKAIAPLPRAPEKPSEYE